MNPRRPTAGALRHRIVSHALSPLGGNDGSWHEGINYTTFTLKYVCHFANSLTSATGINPFDDVPWMRHVGYFRLYLAPAGSIGIYFNDTRPLAVQQWDRPIRVSAGLRDPRPRAAMVCHVASTDSRIKPSSSFYTLLYRDPNLPARDRRRVTAGRIFPTSMDCQPHRSCERRRRGVRLQVAARGSPPPANHGRPRPPGRE